MVVHAHLAEAHGDVLGWRTDELLGYTYCVITCPLCGMSHEQVVRKARKNPDFVEEYKHQIRLVAFDLLLYHLQGEHGFST